MSGWIKDEIDVRWHYFHQSGDWSICGKMHRGRLDKVVSKPSSGKKCSACEQRKEK